MAVPPSARSTVRMCVCACASVCVHIRIVASEMLVLWKLALNTWLSLLHPNFAFTPRLTPHPSLPSHPRTVVAGGSLDIRFLRLYPGRGRDYNVGGVTVHLRVGSMLRVDLGGAASMTGCVRACMRAKAISTP
jgi:hypothetical protein